MALVISSTSRRLPRKTSGLFDTGSAGGDSEAVTSLDGSSVQAAVLDQAAVLSLEDLQSLASLAGPSYPAQPLLPLQLAEDEAGQAAGGTGKWEVQPEEVTPAMLDVDWDVDLLDPLGGLDDPLGDNSLDAFVNLDTFLMGDTFLDECEPLDDGALVPQLPEVSEVKPVIHFTAQPDVIIPEDNFLHTDLVPLANTSTGKAAKKTTTNSRKRKAGNKKTTAQLGEALVTSLFEIPSSPDHDYSSKRLALEVRVPEDVSPAQQPATPCGSGNTTSKPSRTGDKQTVRRMKNNVASKRSREQRKAKFVEMDEEADYLTSENDRLRGVIIELEKKSKEMKDLLIAKMAGKA